MPSLIEIQFEVLLARDPHGRLTVTRDPVPRPAPRVYLGRSRDRNVWAIRFDLDPGTAGRIEGLCASEARLEESHAERPPACRARVCELLAPVQAEHRGPAYLLPVGLPEDPRAREISTAERGHFRTEWPWLADEFDQVAPVAIAFEGKQAAAICHSPRGVTAFAAEAGVETLAHLRSRGLATAAVACWARAVQRRGRLALYSTSWENHASQAIARRLSGRLYGENWHLT